MADANVAPNVEEAVEQVNRNLAAVLEFQNRTSMALLSPGRRTINAKSWQIVDEAIQGLQR